MENLILAMNVVLPILLMMGVGYLLKYWKMVDKPSLNKMNSLVFRVFMSSLLFMNIYTLEAKKVFRMENLRLIAFPVCITLLMLGLASLLFSKTISEKKKCSVMIQAAYRGNFVLFGTSIAETLYGKEALGITSLLLAAVIPTFNIIAILLLESYRGGKITPKQMLSSTFQNPLMIATVLSLFCVFFEISLPKVLEQTIFSLGRVATPLAFIVLGGSLEMGSLKKNWKYICYANGMKLIVLPLLAMLLGHFFGYEKIEMTAFLGATACPVAVASFSMAKEMDADGDLAGEIVASTSAVSIVTIFLWIFILKNLSWI